MSYRYTVLCKMPDDGRGEYSEEIDFVALERTGVAALKRIAQKIIDRDYDPELRPVRVIRSTEIQIQSIS